MKKSTPQFLETKKTTAQVNSEKVPHLDEQNTQECAQFRSQLTSPIFCWIRGTTIGSGSFLRGANKAAPLTVASDLCEDNKVSSSGPGNDIVFTLVLERPAKPNTESKGHDDL